MIYAADEMACGMFRCVWPAMVLKAQGKPVEWSAPGHTNMLASTLRERPDGKGGIVQDVEAVIHPDAEVCVFQRSLHRLHVQAMAKLKAAGVRIVLELDDDFRAVSPNNPAIEMVHPRYSADSNWTYLDKACRIAHTVVVTSDSLARRYGQHADRCVILPNYVPEPYLAIERRPFDPARIGWGGNVYSHPHDLQVATRGIRDAMAATGATFHVVGPGEPVPRMVGCRPDMVSHTGFVPIPQWPHEVARIGVGVAPLADTTFNRGKSWLKPLEMAALGVPCVMSPSAEYRKLHELTGIGYVAENHRQWKALLLTLLHDPERLDEEGELLRRLVAKFELTIEAQAHQWWDAWTG